MDQRPDVSAFVLEAISGELAVGGFRPEDVHPTLNLITAGIIDSLGFLNLVARIEAEYEIELDFTSESPEELATLAGLARLLEAGRNA